MGYTHGLNSNSEYSNFKGKNSIIEYFYEKNVESLKIPRYRVIQAMRFKIILLSYLFTVPQQFGFKVWSPFLDSEIALSMLTLPPSRRKNRIWQRELFQRNGLDLESMNLQRSTQNNLNYQAMCKMPVKPLDVKLLAEVVNPQYVQSINYYLQEKHLGAYCAYLTLKPIENAIKKRQELNMSQSSASISYQQNISKPLIQINSFRVQQWKLTTPVAFIIFNRPDTTQKVFNAIREAKPPKLLVIADGARIDKEGEAELCKQTRAIIDQVDWDCEVLVNYSDVNLGLRKRVSSGLDWVFEQVEEAIILEDDCLPHPTFFRYCQELLEKYRDDERIMMISGDNFQFGRKRSEYSYYFSHYGHCWGWASWRGAWTKYDDSMQLWQELRDNKWLKDVLGNDQAVAYWSRIFQSVYDGFSSWAYIWQYTLWLNSGLTILPNVNLISNIGFGSGTHTTDVNSPLANMKIEAINFPLRHPPFIIRNTQADEFTRLNHFGGNLQQSKSTNTNNITMITKQAINYLNQNQEIQALNLFEGILQNNSENMGSYYGKALSLARLGSLNTAVETLEKLLTIQPQHKKARCLLEEIRPNNLDLLLEKSVQAIQDNQLQKAFNLLNTCKSIRERKRGLDLLRADCFLKMKQPIAALQSAYEELRYFPDNEKAQKLVEELKEQYGKFLTSVIDDPEFQELFQQIRPYTMVSEYRLYSLFSLTKKICQENIQGNFIECGVAGGGSTALMASIIKRYSQIPRKIYACDSFEGMPEPSEKDKSRGVLADLTGWGSGTCAAPEASVIEICQKLDVLDFVETVKGYFENTLPEIKDRVGNIAFMHMDADWYESTKTILKNLYDQVVSDGFIQVDDYGHWDGCREALHEFETERNLKFNLNQIDYSGVWFSMPKLVNARNV